MIKWHEDDELAIFFDTVPSVAMRCILPSMTQAEKKSVQAYPFENKLSVGVRLYDYLRDKRYEFTVPKGFCWDGATIPRVFWRSIGPKTSPVFLIPSMVHDWMCNYHASVNYDRNFSSRVFRGMLIEAGVSKAKAQIMYLAVDNFQRFCGWGDSEKYMSC